MIVSRSAQFFFFYIILGQQNKICHVGASQTHHLEDAIS